MISGKRPPVHHEPGEKAEKSRLRRFRSSARAAFSGFTSGSFASNVALLAGGTAVGQVIAVIASPFLTRIYGPADFGILAVYVSLLSIISTVGALRFEITIPLPKDERTAANLLATSFISALAVAAVVGLLLIFFGSDISEYTNSPTLSRHLWLFPISLFAATSYQILTYWAIREQNFALIARTKVTQAITMVITQLGFGLASLRPVGLIVGDAVGRSGGSTALATLAYRRSRAALASVSRKGIAEAANRYRKFPLVSSGSGLLNSLGLNLPALLMAAMFSSKNAGWFGLSVRVISAPMTLIGLSVAQVYFGKASEFARDEPTALLRLFDQATKKLLLIGVVPMSILGSGGPWIYSTVFGERWIEAGVYTQLMAAMYLAQFVVSPLSQTLNVIERQELQLGWDGARLALVVGSFTLASLLGWSARAAVTIYSGSMFAAYVFLWILTRNTLAKLPAAVDTLGDG